MSSDGSNHDTYFSAFLLKWFDENARRLPWHSRDPYHIWLAEVMLQQTQVETVIPYYERFLKAYPTLADCANAPLADVLKLWEGLGYYRRARHLHETAQTVLREHGGVFPTSVAALLRLKGIGRYTAGAIASIAYDVRAAVLDGNVMRVLARYDDLDADIRQAHVQRQLWARAEALLPSERVGAHNQALMQLGQLVCTPRTPNCAACPLRTQCKAHARGTQAVRPVKAKRAPTPHYDVVAGVIRRQDGRLLIAQRRNEGLLGGLWEFAGGKVEAGETHAQALQRELAEELGVRVAVGALCVRVKHAFTHFKITLHAYHCTYLGALPPYDAPQALQVQAWQWVDEEELARYSFGKADRAIISALLEEKSRFC